MSKVYEIQRRYFVKDEGWKLESHEIEGPYVVAALEASRVAQELDEKHGDNHFWTVDLKNAETGDSYFQLFHGRLS